MRLLLIYLFLGCSFSLAAQLKLETAIIKNEILMPKNDNYLLITKSKTSKLPSLKSLILSTPSEQIYIPSSYSFQELAFFCKIEVQLEQQTKFPIKFRLGDIDSVDKKEGKYHW